jgi:hypothetical protein
MNDQLVQSSQFGTESESQAQLIEQGKCCCLRAGRMLLRSFSPTHVRRKEARMSVILRHPHRRARHSESDAQWQ